ncbi:MAG: universal stress protein [Candidatus Obscuribacterales bacterium]|nr:universal stress protein [Candidatus Obscuribacterales bacterium]
MTNVLIAIDDDRTSGPVIDFVCNHKWSDQTRFRLLCVCPWMPPESQVRTSKDLQHFIEETLKGRKLLLKDSAERIQKELGISAVEIEEVLLQGQASELILELVESWPAELLILGSHGRKGVDLFMMGSISAAMVSHAPCSVIVVRPGKTNSLKSAEMAKSTRA